MSSGGDVPVSGERIVARNEAWESRDLRGQRWNSFDAVGSRFEDCRFDGVQIKHASFGSGRKPSVYSGCTFDGARLKMGAGTRARFVDCSFLDVRIQDWFCFDLELVDCRFSGVMSGSFFNGKVLPHDRLALRRLRNEFRGNDFSELTLVDVGFRTGIDLSLQRFSETSDQLILLDTASAVKAARPVVEQWGDPELQNHGVAILKVLQSSVDSGQRQQLVSRSQVLPHMRKANDLLIDFWLAWSKKG